MKVSDLILWRTFLTVAHEGSFSRAARSLGSAAPNVTKQIARLESRLGTRLFSRTTRAVTLTKDGERLVPHVTSLLEQASALEERASDSQRISGRIRLTCLSGLASRWLAPLLVEFQALHPAVTFEVVASDRLVDLVQEQMDLAIRIQEPKGSDMVFRELKPNELVVCASPRYVERSKKIRRPSDLHDHPLLTLDVHRDLRFTKTGERLEEFVASRKIRCESGPYLTDLALAGAGVAIRARYDVAPFLESGELVELLRAHPLEYFRNIYLVIPQRRYLAARVRLFVDFLVSKRNSIA